MNYAVWVWESRAKPPEHNNWNFQFGPDESSKAAVKTSPLIEAIKKSWSRNVRWKIRARRGSTAQVFWSRRVRFRLRLGLSRRLVRLDHQNRDL